MKINWNLDQQTQEPGPHCPCENCQRTNRELTQMIHEEFDREVIRMVMQSPQGL